MKAKKTDSIITFDVSVSMHQVGKKATAKDKKSAEWLARQSRKLLVSLIEHHTKAKAIEYEPNKYYLGDLR